METTNKESYMENPRKRATLATAAGGDGLHVPVAALFRNFRQ
jgi:hypothetical protein